MPRSRSRWQERQPSGGTAPLRQAQAGWEVRLPAIGRLQSIREQSHPQRETVPSQDAGRPTECPLPEVVQDSPDYLRRTPDSAPDHQPNREGCTHTRDSRCPRRSRRMQSTSRRAGRWRVPRRASPAERTGAHRSWKKRHSRLPACRMDGVTSHGFLARATIEASDAARKDR